MNYLTRVDGTYDEGRCVTLVNTITQGIRERVDLAVLGVSGGADSTLVACLCKVALGGQNAVAVSMPCTKTDLETFNNRSKMLASFLGILHTSFNISEALEGVMGQFIKEPSTLTQGNTRSRLRMVMLYGLCGELSAANPHKRVRVMGTGNLSEDFIGYDTKDGDALADFFPIGELYKQEVYDLLDYFKSQNYIVEEFIDRTPSAGLWEGQTDEGELGHTYNEMAPAVEWLRTRYFACGGHETMMKTLLEGLASGEPEFYQVVKFVLDRHNANSHKHLAPPVLTLR
jgi:NAD+ synthase